MALHLRIVCPVHHAFEGDCAFVTIPSTDGSFGVASLHASEICTLDTGVVSICDARMGEVSHRFLVDSGFAKVSDDDLIILAERAEDLDALNVPELEKRQRDFEDKLRNLSEDDAHRAYLYNEISWCKLLLTNATAA